MTGLTDIARADFRVMKVLLYTVCSGQYVMPYC